MIPYSANLLAVGGAHTGMTPMNLLDVQDVNGNCYYWADRPITETAIIGGEPQQYKPWLLACGPFTFHRSQVTDAGNFKIQNVSGTTLARDLEAILRGSTLEGAVFAYRCWQAGAEEAWLYLTGKLSLQGGTDTIATFTTKPCSNPAEVDAPLEQYAASCQILWKDQRCGSTKSFECLYSFQSCQVVERFFGSLPSFEKNWGESTTNLPGNYINRTRRY